MDVFPLPRVDDSLNILSKAKYFTLDLSSGYSQEMTAFNTYSGLYEFTVMPFGLCNAPATFQRLMETVLSGLVRECCVVYIDAILVVGETFEEHLSNLRKVLDRLREANLKLKPGKCKFAEEGGVPWICGVQAWTLNRSYKSGYCTKICSTKRC